MVKLEVIMAENKAEQTGPKDYTVETMKLLTAMAEKGDLAGVLQLAIEASKYQAVSSGATEAALGNKAKMPTRWPAYSIRLPLRDKHRRHLKDGDLAVLFWGLSLVCTLHRALDGGRRTRIYLTTGRKWRAPTDATVIAAIDLIRRSGLTVRLNDRRIDARVITISH